MRQGIVMLWIHWLAKYIISCLIKVGMDKSFHLDISIIKKDNNVCFESICWNSQRKWIIKKLGLNLASSSWNYKYPVLFISAATCDLLKEKENDENYYFIHNVNSLITNYLYYLYYL